MKSKLLIITVVAALLAAYIMPALAAPDSPDLTRFKQRMEAKKSYVDQAVKSGQLTEEQAKAWKGHFDYMIKFHEKNGFLRTGSGFGKMRGCPGKGAGPGWPPGPGTATPGQ